MTTETMTIHEALSELKIIGDRIDNAIHKEFVTINKKSNKKVNGIPIARVGDSVSIGGSVASGSPNVNAGQEVVL